jgi:hypothetical protein
LFAIFGTRSERGSRYQLLVYSFNDFNPITCCEIDRTFRLGILKPGDLIPIRKRKNGVADGVNVGDEVVLFERPAR